MSHTDKTDPYYVKLNRHGVEYHDHRHGECDFDPDKYAHDPGAGHRYWLFSCGLTQAYWDYYDDEWFAQPKAIRRESKRQNRAERQRVRQAIHHERYDSLAPQGTGRSNAKWACY